MSQEVAKGLPPSILALFAPRPPIEFKRPPKRKKQRPYTGVSSLLGELESKEEAAAATAEWKPYDTLIERRARAAERRKARAEEKAAEIRARWDPTSDPNVTGDPFRTLFVGRISRDMDENALRSELSQFGAVKAVRVVRDRPGLRGRGDGLAGSGEAHGPKRARRESDEGANGDGDGEGDGELPDGELPDFPAGRQPHTAAAAGAGADGSHGEGAGGEPSEALKADAAAKPSRKRARGAAAVQQRAATALADATAAAAAASDSRALAKARKAEALALASKPRPVRSRGYGFVEFESERDLKAAIKGLDGRMLGGRRVLVDVERGRTVRGWAPRKLGAGLGPGRVPKVKTLLKARVGGGGFEPTVRCALALGRDEAAGESMAAPAAPCWT